MFHPELSTYIQKAIHAGNAIAPNRTELLNPLVDYLVKHKSKCQLVFICTHNSRRSHFAQIWAQIAAIHFGFSGVKTFSGGTDATAFHPNAIAAIQRSGIGVEPAYASSVPSVRLNFSDQIQPLEVFSKVYDHPENPNTDFAAVMTCAEADEGCPVVFGADIKIPLHYQDPKVSDGTGEQDQVYDERCFQIASEMFYAFGQATK